MNKTFRFVFYTDATAEKFKNSIEWINSGRILDRITWRYIPCNKNELIKIIEITIDDWYREKDLKELMGAYDRIVKSAALWEDVMNDVYWIKPMRRTNNDVIH